MPEPVPAPPPTNPPEPLLADRTRRFITAVFRLFEDITLVGLGLVLAGCAVFLLVQEAGRFGSHLLALNLSAADVIRLIEQLLLILLIFEILYTVQVTFREHTLAPEPFLVIGLIAGIRRVLVITAELAEPRYTEEAMFRVLMIELGVLTGMILVLVASLVVLRRWAAPAERANRE
jgi:uncharacterized membrane protein (DUF373 family)